MCRAEAHQLYSRKPIFDAMGIQLVACLNEHIDAEVQNLANFVILADFSYFGTNAQNFHNTNFGFNSIIFSFVIPFIHSKVL
jgi:hypothetical protein